MKKLNLKFFCTLLFIAVLALLSIPSFNLQIGDNTVSFPGDNAGALIGKDFNRGAGIYPTNQIIAKIDIVEDKNLSNEQFTDYLNKIQKRLTISGLTEISLQGVRNENGHFVHLNFSQVYDSPEFLTRLLLSPGEFTFIATSEGQNLDLSISDFSSKFSIANSSQILQGSNEAGEATGIIMGTHLVNTLDTTRNPALFERYRNFVSTSQSPIFVVVDDILTLYLIADVNRDTQEVTPLVRFWGIEDEFGNPQVKLNSYRILSSFLSTETLGFKATVDLNEFPIATSSENQYTTSAFNLAIGFVLIIAIIFLFAYRKLKFKRSIIFSLFFVSGLFAWIFLIKLFSASFNINVLVGFLLYLILLTFLCINLTMLNSRDEFTKKIAEYQKYTMVLVFSIVPVFLIGQVNMMILETLTAFLIGLLVIWFLNRFNFKFIFENYFK